MANKVYNPEYPGLYYFDTFTFTTLGTSGHRGPDPTKTYANAPWSADQFSIVNGQQQWTVPATGTYHIVAAGAYGATPGRVVAGDVNLSEGQTLSLLVGQQPTPLTANVVDNVTVGGGGGTFVTSGGKPLMVASGGDGGAYSEGWQNSSTLTVPNTLAYSASMSGDGSRIAVNNINVDTFLQQITIYEYIGGLWSQGIVLDAFMQLNKFYFVKMSGNGTTVLVASQTTGSSNVQVFEYVDSVWTIPQYLQNPDPSGTFGYSCDISYDGNTAVASVQGGITGGTYVYTKNQDLTWNSPVALSDPYPEMGNLGRAVSISGDGTKFCASIQLNTYADGTWVYDGVSGSPVTLTSGHNEGAISLSMSYDGTVIALTTYLKSVKIYINNVLTNERFFVTDNYPLLSQLSYDGTALLIARSDFVSVFRVDVEEYVSTEQSSIQSLVAASMNSSGTRVVNAFESFTSPNLKLYDRIEGGKPGSFTPPGLGTGISGAGYLTDGQVSNPYFGFMKPQAYVDGGFGNTYQYGAQGEGGFGGGQSPLNLQTSLTSVIGYKQVRPSIPLNSSDTIWDMAISEDGNTLLVCMGGVGGTVYANAYTYTDSQWSSQTLLELYKIVGVSLSLDATVWLAGGSVWRNGSLETTLISELFNSGNFVTPSHYSKSVLTPDGNTCVIAAATGGNEYLATYFVFKYTNGTWDTGTQLLFDMPPPLNSTAFSQISISADGTKIAIGESRQENGNRLLIICMYTYTSGSWQRAQIFDTTDTIFFPHLSINSDGSKISFSTDKYSYEYSNGVITTVPYDVTYSRTNPDSYVYSTDDYVYAPFVPLTVKVHINPTNYLLAFGSTVLVTAASIFSGNKAIAFVDMYNPTTTCTATTSAPHGYPYNYKVQITGTNSFNGTWDTVTTGTNTFTFQAFGGPTETSGYVSGTTTGISGGGGYTGSPGDGVSGATCYADASVRNFTDLGAASNTAGTVTVSLIDPQPLQPKWSWQDRTNWAIEGVQFKNCTQIAWSSQFGKFIGINTTVLPVVETSPDGIIWSTVDSNLPLLNFAHAFIITNQGIVLSSEFGLWSTRDAVTWTNTSSTTRDPGVLVGALSNIYFYSLSDVYVSSDGYTWSRYSTPQLDYVAYGQNTFRGLTTDALVFNSSDGITWEQSTNQTGVTSSVSAFTYTNGTFIANGKAPRTLPGEFFLLTSGGTIHVSTDGYTWTNTGVSGAALAYGNNVYVAAITNGFSRSEDTVTWTEVYSPISCQYVTYGNNVFVGLGEGSIVTSSDGNTWTLGNLPSGAWGTLTYGKGLFYVYDYYSSSVVTSINGVDWTTQTGSNLPVSDNPIFAYGNNAFVSVNRYSGTAKYSTDGYTWNNITLSASVLGVTFGNGIFVLVGGVNFYTSVNGSTWIDRGALGNNGINGVAYINGVFSATGYNNGIGGLTSPDGIHWTEHTNTWGFFYQVQMIGASGNRLSNVEIISYSYDGNTWSNVNLIYDSLTQFSSLNGVVIGTNSANVWYSSNMSQWNKNPVTFSLQNTIAPVSELGYCVLTDSKYSYLTIDGRYVVHPVNNSGGFNQTTWSSQLGLFVGTGNGIVSVSKDGQVWTSVSVPLLTGVSAIEWSPELGIFVVYCYGKTFVSNDGYTWTNYSAPSVTLSSGYNALIWSESLGIFTLGGVTTSKDGINWTESTGGSIISPITWSSSLSLFSSGTYYSYDGITWSPTNIQIIPLSISWSSTLDLFLCVDTDGTYVTSSDGINWTSPSSKNIDNQVVPNLFVGADDGISASSINGINWTSSSLPPYGDYTPRVRSIIYGGGIYTIYTVDYVSYTSPDGVQWAVIPNENNLSIVSVAYGNGLYVACDLGYSSILISDDGLNFTRIDTKLPGGSTSVAYGRGIFVVGLTNYSSAPSIATSFDGINWTLQDVPILEYRYVMYGGGLFIGMGYSGYGVITSSDGVNWTQHTIPNSYWYRGAYGNGIYVFCSVYVTNGSIPFMTSPDGITWTARYPAILPDRDWITISFGNGLFVVSDDVNTTITSPDGINWTLRDAPGFHALTHAPPQFTSIVSSWSDELQIFLVLATQDTKTYVFTSIDGVSFTNEGYFEGSRSFLSSLTWSETNGFLLANGESFYISQTPTKTF